MSINKSNYTKRTITDTTNTTYKYLKLNNELEYNVFSINVNFTVAAGEVTFDHSRIITNLDTHI